MFNTKKPATDMIIEKTNGNGNGSGGGTTLVSAGTTIKGDISSNSDLRIDGSVIGNIHSSAKIIIGSSGVVEGDILGQNADIVGKTSGTIKVKELLQLRGDCVVIGNIYATRLQIEPSATFNGQCHMGANVVDMNINEEISLAK